MRRNLLAPLAPPALGVPAVLIGVLPNWGFLVLLAVSVLLTAAQIVVTQVIRLRVSRKIPRSQDAVRVLEIEAFPQHPGRGRAE